MYGRAFSGEFICTPGISFIRSLRRRLSFITYLRFFRRFRRFQQRRQSLLSPAYPEFPSTYCSPDRRREYTGLCARFIYIKRSHALGTVNLVCADAHKVYSAAFGTERNFHIALHIVNVQKSGRIFALYDFLRFSVGITEPTSLLTAITDTNIVFSSMAFSKSFKLILPSLCGCTLTTSNPLSSRRSIHFSTLGCSKAVVTIFLPSRFFAPTVPNIAVLFDTVPQG